MSIRHRFSHWKNQKLSRLINSPESRKSRSHYDGYFVTAKADGALMAPDSSLQALQPIVPNKGALAASPPVVFVNGICDKPQKVTEELQILANETGRPFIGIYNATQGFWRDVKQAADDLLSPETNSATLALARYIMRRLNAPGEIHIAGHSQGGLIVRNALNLVKSELKKHLPKAKVEAAMNRLNVLTIAAATNDFPDGPNYHHFRNRFDIVNLFSGATFGFGNEGKNAQVTNVDYPRPLDCHGIQRYVDAAEIDFA